MSDKAREFSPVIFFGTDAVRNDGVKDFRPTAVSAIRAEEEKKAAEVEEQFSAPAEDKAESDPKDPDPETVAKVEHPADAAPATADTTPPALSHPDLDVLFGE